MTTEFKHSSFSTALNTEAKCSYVPKHNLDASWDEPKHHSSGKVHTYSPKDRIGGKSQRELADQWWKYIQETPASKNPLTSAKNEFPRFGNVQFLTGTGGTIPPGPIQRSIRINTKTSLFAPLQTQEVDPVGLDPAWTEADSRAVAKAIMDTVSNGYFNLVEGGKEISLLGSDFKAYRQTSPKGGFSFTVPEDSFVGYPSGLKVKNAVQDGYWVGVKPLDPGTYTFHFGATLDYSKIVVDQNNNGIEGDTLGEKALQDIRAFFTTPGVDPLSVQDITYKVKVFSAEG